MVETFNILKFKIGRVCKLNKNIDGFKNTTEIEKQIVSSLLQEISSNENYKLLFRGEKKSGLRLKLFSQKNDDYKEEKLFERLFYFGDKAKGYFKNSPNTDYLKNINDSTKDTFEYIFDELSKIFFNKANTSTIPIENFKYDNKDFYKYFNNTDNKAEFIKNIVNVKNERLKLQIRDYYLYLLHTNNSPEFKDRSYFVSTTEEKQISLTHNNNIVFIYFIKKPFANYGINLKIINDIQTALQEQKLPSFSSDLYSGEKEFSVKGVLFPHQIIAIYDTADNKMILNPHMFLDEQTVDDILYNGIKIDQTLFSKKILNTSFNDYVTYFADKNIFSDDMLEQKKE